MVAWVFPLPRKFIFVLSKNVHVTINPAAYLKYKMNAPFFFLFFFFFFFFLVMYYFVFIVEFGELDDVGLVGLFLAVVFHLYF